jgi:hypothetical protein
VVVLRWPDAYPEAFSTTATYTLIGEYRYYTFTSSGTMTI